MVSSRGLCAAFVTEKGDWTKLAKIYHNRRITCHTHDILKTCEKHIMYIISKKLMCSTNMPNMRCIRAIHVRHRRYCTNHNNRAHHNIAHHNMACHTVTPHDTTSHDMTWHHMTNTDKHEHKHKHTNIHTLQTCHKSCISESRVITVQQSQCHLQPNHSSQPAFSFIWKRRFSTVRGPKRTSMFF